MVVAMSDVSNKSRRLARERYWSEHEKSSYTCPDCGRGESEIVGTFQVHHKTGTPHDNRMESLVGLCGACHRLRENKKPSIKRIEKLRDHDHEISLREADWLFVDEYVCMCAEGENSDWHDSLKTWMRLYEQHLDAIDVVPPRPPEIHLPEFLHSLSGSHVQHSDGAVTVTGPAPSDCDCVTAADVVDIRWRRSL